MCEISKTALLCVLVGLFYGACGDDATATPGSDTDTDTDSDADASVCDTPCSQTADSCCPKKCTAANDADCCEAAACSVSSDGCCPGKCAGACGDSDCDQCDSGVCCNTTACEFASADTACDGGVEYRCDGSGCGADAQRREYVWYCSGTSARCDGEKVGAWTPTPCSDDALCDTDNVSYAICNSCSPHICGSGACWPECDPADTCCEMDGYNCALGCKLNGACYLPMTDCDGGKYDPNNDLCWQDPPNTDGTNWYVATGTLDETHNPEVDGGVENYCAGLGEEWRLPSISELRSLIRGCSEVGWVLDWASPPVDNCGVYDGCLTYVDCHDDPCLPNHCPNWDGPGTGGTNEAGCYWDPELNGTCDERFWSSSTDGPVSNRAWRMYFHNGNLLYNDKNWEYSVRCVRDSEDLDGGVDGGADGGL